MYSLSEWVSGREIAEVMVMVMDMGRDMARHGMDGVTGARASSEPSMDDRYDDCCV